MAVRKTATSGKRGKKVIRKAGETQRQREAAKVGPKKPRRMNPKKRKSPDEYIAMSPKQREAYQRRAVEDIRRRVIDKEPLIKVRAGVPHRLDERRKYDKGASRKKS